MKKLLALSLLIATNTNGSWFSRVFRSATKPTFFIKDSTQLGLIVGGSGLVAGTATAYTVQKIKNAFHIINDSLDDRARSHSRHLFNSWVPGMATGAATSAMVYLVTKGRYIPRIVETAQAATSSLDLRLKPFYKVTQGDQKGLLEAAIQFSGKQYPLASSIRKLKKAGKELRDQERMMLAAYEATHDRNLQDLLELLQLTHVTIGTTIADLGAHPLTADQQKLLLAYGKQEREVTNEKIENLQGYADVAATGAKALATVLGKAAIIYMEHKDTSKKK